LFLDFESNAEIPQAFDVCVVGGGVIGLVTAWALAQSQLRVIVIEAGGLRDEWRSQSLYDTGEFTGLKNNGVAMAASGYTVGLEHGGPRNWRRPSRPS